MNKEKDTFNYDAAVEFLKNKSTTVDKQYEQLFKDATKDCRNIIEMIIKKYNPKRIYQWGSLLKPQNFKDYSDIDIAVEGLKSAEEFFALFGDAEDMTIFPLDLVEVEKVAEMYKDSITVEGKLVYERK